LTTVLERETRFLDQVKLMSLQEGRKTTFCVAPFAWLLQNGYIARSNEFVFEGTTLILKNWIQGDFYMGSRHWERAGMPPYPYEIDYCSMIGEDIENDPQAWEAIEKLMEVDPAKLTRIVKVIFEKAGEFFDMTRFPTTDKGVFGPLLRIQQALMAIQRRIIAAEEQLRKSLETIVTTTPTSLEPLRTQELMMRDFVRLVEQSRYLPRGDQEDYWGNQFI